jgi:predicted GIY-YIG superfamily endonuclease
MDLQMKSSRNKEGYVYIISNSNFPGYYKVGVTNDIKSRLRTYQTSSPLRNYRIEHYIHHPDCYEAEKQIGEKLKYFATEIKNEWFKCDIEFVKNRLNESLEVEENPLTFFKKDV